ncbi:MULTISPECIES: hypothetical protein [Roseovarius]|uniref:hypothetical protein n=1 Tax=Roseovarius TaxID=74030 RepID=UPI00273F6320|nr:MULTISPECIES: hypothetical protein [unclassified Roseovarius]
MPDEFKMTRQEMQTEALVIENLLDAALVMQSDPNRQETVQIIEMAQGRIERLGRALDSVNAAD